ncbi:MGMT family protein [Alcanivorax sp. 1008]|uniref:MGMT family protein n=1 Tax=Alcanivorax sp. 1008 TaxID=2816853 RepID=UPI001E023B3C|nr:MGMT family protein [Alcanivorax sp. 1008]MCC1495379.1 MGMT family protein [Alcanivorax sp. 1008]
MPVAVDPQSEFAHAVYQIMAAIPPGKVASYGAIAAQAGFPRHARFVGRLMGTLPKGSKLPWWRVIRSDGRSGMTGAAAERQLTRLVAEGVIVIGGRVDMRRYAAFL